MPVRKPTLSAEVAKPDTSANAQLAAEVLDTYSGAIDLALGLEKRSLSAVSRWNMHAIEVAASLAPVVCDLFSLAVKACVELQLNWLSWLPGWQMGGAADAPTCGQRERQSRNEQAHTMDLAMGAQPAEPVLAFPAALNAAAPHSEDQPPTAMPEQPEETPKESAMVARSVA